MSSQKLVSIVIANYNMGKFLPLAVQSVLNQTYANIEIHVVDDGSTDDSTEVMKQFDSDPRVHYHYKPNQGQASAKNRGILESKGDFIAFLDADDLWTPTKIEKQMPCFNTSHKVGVVYTNYSLMTEEGEIAPAPSRKYYSGNITGRLLIENIVTGMTSIVRRECFETVGLFDESLPMGIDYDLWLRISAKYEFLFFDEITYLYRQWGGQMSHNYMKRYECGIKIMKKFLETHPGLVDQKTIDEAWAHTYVGRGRCLAEFKKNRLGALKDYLYALKNKPGYLPAWKSIAKLFIPQS